MQPQLEPGRDTEVAAAAADPPEEVWVRLGVHAEELAVRGHHVSGEQVVDRKAVLADEVADSSAEREPADPDRAGIPERRRQAKLRGGARVTAGRYTFPHPGPAASAIALQHR